MIRLEKCNFSYGKSVVFQGADLQLDGGITFIVGQNGSGKSTLLQLLAGWIASSAVSTDLGHIAYLPTHYHLNSHLSIRDITDIYEIPWEKFSTSSIFSALQLQHLQNSRLVHELSSGELQRLLLAAVINQRADSLILDEPFNHLDWNAQKNLLKELKHTRYKHLLITTHDFQAVLDIPAANLLLVDDKKIHDLGLSKEALISEKFQNSFHFRTQIIDNPIDRTSILAIAEKK